MESPMRALNEQKSEATDTRFNDKQTSEVFCSNDHFVAINGKFQVFLDNQELCDITLISADGEYKVGAHKVILALVSDYFLAMFSGALSEAKAKEVKLSQMDGQSLKAIINFIYKGFIELTVDSVESVVVAAHFLELSTLEKICCDYMKKNLDVSNCLGIAFFAKLHEFDDLYNSAILFTCENFVNLWEEEEFLSLTLDGLCELISMDDLRLPNEGHVFHAIMAWINHNRDDRKQFLEKLFSYVRFPLLSPAFIAKFIEKECESAETSQIVCKALAWHASPLDFPTIFSPLQHRVRNLKNAIVVINGIENTNEDLNVAIYYSRKWTYTKWPTAPNPRRCPKYTTLGKRLLVTGGDCANGHAIHVDCLNLETLEWTEFPAIPENFKLLHFVTAAETVYALGDNCYCMLAKPYEEWRQVSTSLNPKFNMCTVYKDEIYFARDNYFAKLSHPSITLEYQKRRSDGFGIGLHVIEFEGVPFIIEIEKNCISPVCNVHYNILNGNEGMATQEEVRVDCVKSKIHNSHLILFSAAECFKHVSPEKIATLPHKKGGFNFSSIVLTDADNIGMIKLKNLHFSK